MEHTVKNKAILRSNAALVEAIVKSKDNKSIKEKSKGNILLHVNFKESDIGYVKIVIEENGLMSYMYLPFYNVGEEKNDEGVDSKNIYKACNEVNKMLSPARLVVNDGKVYCLSLVSINIAPLKKADLIEIFNSFKNATTSTLSAFKETIAKVGFLDA